MLKSVFVESLLFSQVIRVLKPQTNKKQDQSGRILILNVRGSNNHLLLINLYNSNNVYEQLNTLSTLCSLLYDIIDLYCKNIIFGGDFNIFFNLTCKACGGNPKMKNKSVAKYILIKESLGLCDIWQIRNLKKKRYTLRQQHFTGFNQRSLDYFLFSNNLQESINKTDILTTLSGDHSPVFISLSIDIS